METRVAGPGNLCADDYLLFTVEISCWPSVTPLCRSTSGMMSCASWTGAVPELLAVRGGLYRPVLRGCHVIAETEPTGPLPDLWGF